MIKEIENKIGQLQYEISCLGLDKEDLTGVSIRTEELKDLVKKLTIPDVSLSSCCKGTGLSKDEYGDEIYCSCEIGINLAKKLYED